MTAVNSVQVVPSPAYNKGSLNNFMPSVSTSSQKQSFMTPAKKETIVNKLNLLVQQLEKCCKCVECPKPKGDVCEHRKEVQPTEQDFTKLDLCEFQAAPRSDQCKKEYPRPDPCVFQEYTKPGWPCPEKPCTPTGSARFGLKPRPPFRDIPIGGCRKVPFEIDWKIYPLLTAAPVRERRFKSNIADVSAAERTRKDIQICMRPWLPEPVDLGGNGKAWDLKRYPSRELIESNLIFGCDCSKNNGLQDYCRRKDCRGGPACIHEPQPLCKPSGGPGPSALCPEELESKKKHKNNCWCPICRPSCFPQKTEEDLGGRCPGCFGRDNPKCGSSCEHYCDKHMSGSKEIPAPPLMC